MFEDNLTKAQASKLICGVWHSSGIIVVFSDEPQQIQRTLHEVVHLADKLAHTKETRARFVDHVYFALIDSL